jgi:diguanylate cyclase (GGDEF)-like protein
MEAFLLAILLALAVGALLLTAAAWYYASRQSFGRAQQELMAFSALEVESALLPSDLEPNLSRILEKLCSVTRREQAAIYINERWQTALPSVQRGFSADFLTELKTGAGDLLSNIVFRRGGSGVFRNLARELAQLPPGEEERALRLRLVLERAGVRALTAVSLQTRERNFGVLLFPHVMRSGFSGSRLELLRSLATQISLTLDNYVLMQKAQRRTKEYELLTQVGQVVSSHLDPDEALRAIHKELGQLFDTSTFYVAFLDGDELRFALEVDEGNFVPKRSRKTTNGLSEHVIRTGKSLLIQSDMEAERARLGAVPAGRPAKCFCGVPIFRFGRPVGVMAAMHYEREFVFSKRDLEVMETAAGQVAVAMENARLFAQELTRAHYLEFLNTISKMAISSQDSEQMLGEIVAEVQKQFNFDHIGIGILDYVTKDIEIKAEAGITSRALGKRIPLGSGIIGRVARTNEVGLVQGEIADAHLHGILPESRSVLCLPLTYGETLLGVLNLESRKENAFAPQEVLTLRTLADLLATALHNAFVFQKVQQQSITDGLTGIKTWRFFIESVQAEWKRASRSGRPFSVVLMDLDKFKEVNDSAGHLEGDLVLARVGRLLEQKCRQSNVVARYGGDEFVVLMPETGIEQAQVLSERLRLWIATDPMLSEHQITGSFGVATYPLHGTTVEDIIRVADAGMYVSKHAGGNQVSTAEEFAESDTPAHRRELMSAYVESFLQRAQTGMDSTEELVSTLKRLSGEGDDSSGEELRAAVRMLTRAAETREVCSGHGDSVAKFAEIIGHEMLLSDQELADLVFAARVHDVGKFIIPERILNKPGPLTEEEFKLVKQHAAVGAEIVQVVPGSDQICEIIRHHHERFDGSGYPDGHRGEKIPLGARIIAVAEAYVDMTSERPYAQIKSQTDAFAELESLSGVQFDGMLVRILIHQLRTEKAAKSGS